MTAPWSRASTCPATLVHTHGVSRCLLPHDHGPATQHWAKCDLCADYGDDVDLDWTEANEDWTAGGRQ
jgi:hypothetical protein